MVEAETGSWAPWETIVPEFKYQRSAPFFDLIVPTVDTARMKYILRADAEAGFHVLIGGNSGVGKTVIVKVFCISYLRAVLTIFEPIPTC
jgi:dynein heavy chain